MKAQAKFTVFLTDEHDQRVALIADMIGISKQAVIRKLIENCTVKQVTRQDIAADLIAPMPVPLVAVESS